MSRHPISPPLSVPGPELAALGQTVVLPDAAASVQSLPNLGATIVAPEPAASSQRVAAVSAPSSPPSRYEPVRPLGEGGMGEVMLSRDPTIGRQVAIKRMKRLDKDLTAAERFMFEVRTTGKLEHPGIVPIYDAGHDAEGKPYFVMKYVEGEPLDQIIARLKSGDPEYLRRFSYEVRTQMFMQLLRAVQYAHHQGVLHLDIKPANVIVGPFGEVVLVDWGIARGPGSGSQPAAATGVQGSMAVITFTGTPDYMSPEQALCKTEDIGPHTDTYCLSVLFYELITLHYYLPVKQTLEGRVASILLDQPLTGLQMHHRFGAPPELTNYIHYGLNKDIQLRFRTVDEMVEKLQRVMNGMIPVVCPCTGIKRIASSYGNFMNAHPIWAVVGVCLLALFALFGLFEAGRLLIPKLM